MKRNLKTVAAFAADSPFTQPAIRWQIFNAATNGLDELGAIVRIRGRVFIDVDRYDEWIERQNQRCSEPSHVRPCDERV